MQNTAN